MSTAVLERPVEVEPGWVACSHIRVTHQHGTWQMYASSDQCRCTPCKSAHSSHELARRRQIAYGRYNAGLVPAAPVLKRMQELRSAGLSPRRISELTGLSMTTISRLMYGKSSQAVVTPRIARIVMAVEPDLALVPDGTVIDGTGTARRVQALVAIGWNQTRIALMLGVDPTHVVRFIQGRPLRAGTARKVSALYDELWDRPCPPSRSQKFALNMAEARGWVPPMAWDDDTMDDPASRPSGVRGPWEVRDSKIEDFRRCADKGMNRRMIAAELGYTDPKAIIRLLERAGEQAVLETIRRNDARKDRP